MQWFYHLDFPWWQFVARGVAVYIFLMVLLRLTGKRQVGQLAPFDLVLLLVLSNAVQNAMNGGDNSVLGGMISAVTLVGANYIVAFGTYRSKKLAGLIEGHPLILIHNGHVYEKAMRHAKLTMHELNAALRAEGHANLETVLCAMLENNGHISVVGKNNGGGAT